MNTYIAYFSAGGGVMVKIEMVHEGKIYGPETLEQACNRMAEKLGFEFLYFEYKEDGRD